MKTYKINEIPNKRILGRNVKNAGNENKPLALFWGASALEINVKSNQVWVQVSSAYDNAEPWVAIFVNGAQTGRFMVPAGEPQWVCIAANLSKEAENLISILKDTQPMSSEEHHSLFIHGIKLSDDGEFCLVKPRERTIEFIGDSITSGEGLAGSPEENDWIPQWFCSSKTYAVQTAMALNADWKTFSQSGWGICWGWDGNRNNQMPSHYEEVCSVMWGEYQNGLGAGDKYDFEDGSDIVVLNLGTNDNGAFSQPAWKDEKGKEYPLLIEKDGPVVSEAVVSFLKKIRKFNPKAKIIWAWGMIKLDKIPPYISEGVNQYKKETGDKDVYTLVLDAMEDVELKREDKGSRGHPGPKTHKLAADKLAEFMSKL